MPPEMYKRNKGTLTNFLILTFVTLGLLLYATTKASSSN